eukprot:scaffold4867_cov161-Ochromonas_danica.AAC.7
MTVFSEDDVAGLANMGNAAFNSVYLARLNTREFAIPNGNDTVKLKDFIRQKYVEKKWHRDFGTAGIAASSLQGNNTGGSLPETRDTPSPAPAPGRINISLNKTGSFSASRRASTGSVDVATKRSTSSDLAGDLMGLSVSNDPFGSSPSHASNDPFATGTSTTSTISNHDPFSTPAPASAISNHDPFGAPSNHSFDAFGINAPASSAAATFDPFGSSAPASAPNGGFSAFDHAPAAPVNAFAPSMAMAPMPYIRTAPPPPAAPVPEKVEAKETKPHEKNFSAFDDLISLPAAQPPSLNTHSNNPFEAGGAAAAPAPAGPYGAPQPGYGNAPPNGPYGVPPGAHYGYAPQPGPYGGVPPQQMAYPPAPGYGYPPAGYGAPPPGYYMPQGAPAGAPPAGPYGVHTGAPQPGYGGAPQPGYGAAPAHQPNQQTAAAPAQPDPFAAMGSLAWGSVGGMPQLPPAVALSPTAAAAPVASQPAPAPVYPTVSTSFGASAPAPGVAAAPAPASVNPFDLF